jgi:hypothetical protein
MLNTTVSASNGTDGQIPIDMQAYENDYLFDLLGYRVLEQAIAPDQLQRVNDWVDAQPARQPGDWVGNIHVHSYQGHDGTNYQNIIEGGEVFEEMMDNPPWYDAARRYIVNDFNGLSIQENFLNVREQGGYIGIHSGGHVPAAIFSFRHHTGAWNVGQINVLMALTDIGPGDGCTTVIPGSHKSHETHPALRAIGDRVGKPQSYNDDVVAGDQIGMREVHLKAGDALMFTDAICHGSAARTNPGHRRVMIYRYSPHNLLPRFNYLPSDELIARLTPERRQLIQPIPPRMRPGRVLRA